jgi:hypothetical protein
MKKTIELDSETLDKLTVMNLVEYRDSLLDQLKKHYKNPMMREDFDNTVRTLGALDTILRNFGVEDV